MSFFIKGKHPNNATKRTKHAGQRSKKRKIEELPRADEVTSSEDEGSENKPVLSETDDDETAQDKRLRLAKLYLEEIERTEREKKEDKEISKEVLSKRLMDDYLMQSGKLRTSVANKYKKADLENIKILKCKQQKNTPTCLCITADNKHVFSGSKDGVIVKWSLEDMKKVGFISYMKQPYIESINGRNKKILSIAVCTDSEYLVVGDSSCDIQIWNPTTLKHIGTLKGHKDSVTGVCFKRGTHILYSCSKDRSVKVWNLDEMSYMETLYGHQDVITSIHTLSKDKVLTSGGKDGTLRIWKITEESQLIYNGHSGSIDTVHMINDENFVSGGDDGMLCIWSSMRKKAICSKTNSHGVDPKNAQPYWICSVTSLFNADLVASGSQDGSIKIWKLSEGFRSIELIIEIPCEGFINSLEFTSDGKFLVAAVGKDHRYGRWSTVPSAKHCIYVIPFLITE